MSKVKTLTILGVGYVLGARAGRQRYEQLKRQAIRAADHPRAQQLSRRARETVAAKLPPSVTTRFDRAGRASTSGPAAAVTTAVPSGQTAGYAADPDGVQPATPPSRL
jgi:hypothetical protein